MTNDDTFPKVLNHERILEERAALEDVNELVLNGMTVISGHHPEHGRVHMILPAIGDGVMLLASILGLVLVSSISLTAPKYFQALAC